jgi:hypothetical protein
MFDVANEGKVSEMPLKDAALPDKNKNFNLSTVSINS